MSITFGVESSINFGYTIHFMRKNLVQKAVKAAGGQTAIATQLGIAQSAVSKWVKTGRVPPKRVLILERLSGVSRHVLRPDIYPRDNLA